MSNYFTEDFSKLPNWRKIEVLTDAVYREYATAGEDAVDDNDLTEIDIAIRTLLDYRSKLDA